jgi:hypothetical protein
MFDYRELTLWVLDHLSEDFVEGTFFMAGDSFGKWTEWNRDQLHRQLTFGGPRALMVLESQAEVLTFLLAIVRKPVDPVAHENGNDLLVLLVQTQLRTGEDRFLNFTIIYEVFVAASL